MSYDNWKANTPDHLQSYMQSEPIPHLCRTCRATQTEVWHHTHLGVQCDCCYHIAQEQERKGSAA